MRNLLQNKFERILQKKAILVLALIIMPLMIVLAIFFSGHSSIKEQIGYLGTDITNLPKCDQYTVVPISEMPKLSQMAEGMYAAVVSKDNHNKYTVTTLKSDTDSAAIETLFTTGQLPSNYKGDDAKRKERGTGTNILGFITMLIIIQGVALTTMYPEDRNLRTLRRIMSSSANIYSYLFAQIIFTFISLYLPTYVAIILAKRCFGAELGYSIDLLAVLLLIITLFATAFAIFISTVLDRNINLVTSGVTIITCVLSGCFLSISSDNVILMTICNALPQKVYMDIVHGVEFGGHFSDYGGELFYLFALSMLFYTITISVVATKTSKGAY
ncbi:ABC-2 type transport system permease protein [Aequitasia blattaphilus]|uniref:ABC transporter permease n=1 Tax=Aequitasia blattaphilus TaxID=2949332 RepID=A0ABT1EBI5_9FIRM|nr:ABC transporter permease [Aequitasia blattaphilus]MCP1103198.1 ABC transporter permease [Aequitasia blattaphilus]MCR8615838.1 ABC transporter permease [Aequitasia blattaphilus]